MPEMCAAVFERQAQRIHEMAHGLRADVVEP
jgi:hypothetical protein